MIKVFSKRYAFAALANLIGILFISVSIIISLYLAKQQAIEKEVSQLEVLNRNVLARMQKASDQFANSVQMLAMSPPGMACSEDNIRKMQQVNISGGSLQAIGHVVDNKFQCSSLDNLLSGFDLGPPKIIEPSGVRVWIDVTIPKAPELKYIVIESYGYAALLLPIGATDLIGSPNTSIGIFSIESKFFYTSKGLIHPEWVRDYQGGVQPPFIDSKEDYLVQILPNETGKSAVIAAIPTSEISKNVLDFAKLLIPLGVFFGLGLSAVFIFLARNQYSAKTELAGALKNKEFYLEYQPIIDLRTHACVGAEALIRWNQQDGTQVRPDLFIPLAEESGLIRQVTKQVLKMVAKDMAELLREYPDFRLGINLFAADLQSEETVHLLKDMVNEIGPGNGQFVIEATERGFLNDGVAQKVVNSIRNMNMQVAIDDFGTGYSSLSYLTKFELDYLKIDKTFVDAIGTDAVTSHVAFHIIEMAKSLNLKMVAEGVETEHQASILMEHGVIYVQGWLFAKSMSPDDLRAYVEGQDLLAGFL